MATWGLLSKILLQSLLFILYCLQEAACGNLRKSDLKGQPPGQNPNWEEALSFWPESAYLWWELERNLFWVSPACFAGFQCFGDSFLILI